MNEKRQFNVYLPHELVKRVKHAAIEQEQRLSDFVAAALEAYVSAPAGGSPGAAGEGGLREDKKEQR